MSTHTHTWACDRGAPSLFTYTMEFPATTLQPEWTTYNVASTETAPLLLPPMPVPRKVFNCGSARSHPRRVYLNKFCRHRQDGEKKKGPQKKHNSHFAHSTALIVGVGEEGPWCFLPPTHHTQDCTVPRFRFLGGLFSSSRCAKAAFASEWIYIYNYG